ncbi:hypothetical protein DH2020_050027 [Rehmannia glutinosa]|uniref:Fungal lipase-type domain-containing protein n=1 Tax=Rehmannia glutinosa TaxID=99300 RepID=A0ABR0U231_REHGL
MASTCDKSFASNYLLVNSKEATFLDLFKILFSSDVGKRKFVDVPDGVRLSIDRRWIILVAVLIQKILEFLSKPMAWFGSMIENFLNLLSGNNGFFGLLRNFFRGKIVYPDKTSASFVSFIGHCDKRRELDSNIEYGDSRYYAALSMMACKASYENHNYIQTIVEDDWKNKLIKSLHLSTDYQEKANTQACVLTDNKNVTIVAFRGTETYSADDWSTDFDISWYELPGVGKIHAGFMKALGLQKSQGWPKNQADGKPVTAYYALRKLLKEKLQNNDKARFIVTGHSLGGALASLLPAVLSLHDESWLLDRLEAVYTFGQPRVGDETFAQYMETTFKNNYISYYRCVYSFDLVPRVPLDDSTFMFKHFGTKNCIYFNSFYTGQVLAEEPNKNYFDVKYLLPKYANAAWELVRSFTISCTRGADYKESGLLRIFRLFGLIIPGIPPHLLQDYVNSTRLVSSDVFVTNVYSIDDMEMEKLSIMIVGK